LAESQRLDAGDDAQILEFVAGDDERRLDVFDNRLDLGGCEPPIDGSGNDAGLVDCEDQFKVLGAVFVNDGDAVAGSRPNFSTRPPASSELDLLSSP